MEIITKIYKKLKTTSSNISLSSETIDTALILKLSRTKISALIPDFIINNVLGKAVSKL